MKDCENLQHPHRWSVANQSGIGELADRAKGILRREDCGPTYARKYIYPKLVADILRAYGVLESAVNYRKGLGLRLLRLPM